MKIKVWHTVGKKSGEVPRSVRFESEYVGNRWVSNRTHVKETDKTVDVKFTFKIGLIYGTYISFN